MLLKDELDEKVRQHRLKPPPPPQPKEKEKNVQKVKKEKHQASPEKIQKRAMKDARYVWKKLRNFFLANVEFNGPFGLTDIKVCFCQDTNNSYTVNRVFAAQGISIYCFCICKKRIKYIEETSKLVQQMAQDEGLTISNIHYDDKMLPSQSIFDTLEYFPGDAQVYGNWICFVYQAPSVKEN